MARTHTQTIAESATAAPPPEPKKRGRPRVKPDAEEEDTTDEGIAAAEAKSAIDSDTDTPFFDWLQMFASRDWEESLLLYLWRTAPMIDRHRTGNDAYIQRFTTPVTQEEIKRANYGGSGGYKCTLNRWNPHTRKYTRLRDHYFQILDKQFPPCIPYGEWIESDKNKEWNWAAPILKKISEDEKRIAERENGEAPAGAIAPTIEDELGRFSKILELAEKFQARGAGDSAELARQVLTAIEKTSGRNDGGLLEKFVLPMLLRQIETPRGPDPMTALLMEELKSMRAAHAELMKSNQPRSLADQLKDLAALRTLTTSVFPRGKEQEQGTDWPGAIVGTVEKLIEAAPAYIQAYAAGRNGAAPRPPQPRQNAPAAAPRVDGTPTPAAAPGGEEETMFALRQMANQFGPLIDESAGVLSDQFTRGMTGMHFRNWFIDSYGNKAYNFIRGLDPKTIVGITRIRAAEAPDQITKNQLAQLQPEALYLEFVNQFLSDTPTPEEMEDGPEGAAETRKF